MAESKNGTFLFDRGYMDYHSDRFHDHSLMFYRDGRLLAVLPAHDDGDTLHTHRGLTYGGLLMSPQLTIAETMTLFREMNDMLRAEGFRHVSYKAIPWIYHRLSAEEDLYALYHECKARIVARDYSTNIFLGANLRWERVRRRGIVRAQRAGLQVEVSDSYADFWHVLADNLGSKYGVRPVHTLDEIELLRYDDERKTLRIRVVCGKGTYIRALARDIGQALGSGAFLTDLRRTRVGEVTVEQCLTLEQVPAWLDSLQIENENNKQ